MPDVYTESEGAEPYLDEEVFECGCCGYFAVFGTNMKGEPVFSYEYDTRVAVERQARARLRAIREAMNAGRLHRD